MALSLIPTGVQFPLADGVKYINDAIQSADQAKSNSESAITTANGAEQTANTALDNSESTQNQLDDVIIESGTSDAETIEARTNSRGKTFDILRDRINDLDIEFKQRAVNPIWYGASASTQETTGTIAASSTSLSVASVIDFAVGHGIAIKNAGANTETEVSQLQVTAGASVDGNVIVTLDGDPTAVAVAAGDTAVMVADKIRNTAFAGWTTGGTAGTDTVTFTCDTPGAKLDITYSDNGTGATGTPSTTTQGYTDYFVAEVTAIDSANNTITIDTAAPVAATDTTIKHDDSAAIQSAVDACVKGGGVTGVGKTYVVSEVNLKSDMTLREFYFESRGGSEDLKSPVTVGGSKDTTLRENIMIYKVHVDGKRHLHTNIDGAENGGRMGFRLIGHIRNLTVSKSSAKYCASNGFNLFAGGNGTVKTEDPNAQVKKNVRFIDCEFEWNKHHGGSGDSIDDVKFIDCKFDNNGQTINGGTTEGEKGGTLNGSLYANGVDFEGYAVRSLITNVKFIECQALQNAKGGLLFLEQTDPTDPDFVPRSGISIHSCLLDSGTRTDNNIALSFTPIAANFGLGIVYENISIIDTGITGTPLLRDSNDAHFDGGYINNINGSSAATLDNTTNAKLGTTKTFGKEFSVGNGSTLIKFVSLNENGTLSVPKQSFVKAYQATSQAITAEEKLLYDTVQTDAQNEFDTANARFTAKTDGLYAVNAACMLSNVASGVNAQLMYYINGLLGANLYKNFTTSTGNILLQGNYIAAVKVGDYIEINVKISGGDTVAGGANTYLVITKIS
jgi:hypothetical protein